MTPDQVERYVDATAAALNLPLRRDHRVGVLQFVALAAGMAALVEAVPLDPHDEPAVRFEPVPPRERV